MPLTAISDTILDDSSSPERLRSALDDFASLCSDIGGIIPDPSFDGWANDSLLDSGVAINPQAAAHCVKDYRRSAVFIRGVYAAINSARMRFGDTPVRILYAGCGPFATLVLPLLGKFSPGELDLTLLDIHRRSLDSVNQLLEHFGLDNHQIHTVQGDACHYQHPGDLHLVIAETMQKSLEQEPQFAVTANLAPQLCSRGIFIPEEISVALCLAHLDSELAMFKQSGKIDYESLVSAGKRHPLATVFTLSPKLAAAQLQAAERNERSSKLELSATTIEIPRVANLAGFDALLFTRIQVFSHYHLQDYEAEITLPQRCHELSPLAGGDSYKICYQLGSYPKFAMTRINDCEA